MSSSRSQKGNFFGAAAKEGIALLFPDTSPRGAGIEGETDHWDFGVGASTSLHITARAKPKHHEGAGFYLNATNPKWSKHYNMLTHVVIELPQTLEGAGVPVVRLSSPPSFVLRSSVPTAGLHYLHLRPK